MSESEASAISRMRCREIMAKSVKTATRDMTLQQVASLMRDGDMGAVPVVENGKLVGIVTDRDIVVRSVADGHGADVEIGHCKGSSGRRLRRLLRAASAAGEFGCFLDAGAENAQ